MVALSMNEVSKSLLTAGLYFAFSGPVSEYFKENLYLSDATLATFVGIAFGPIAANFLNPQAWVGGEEEAFIRVTLEISRTVIGFQVLITGINLPPRYLRKEWLSLLMLLLPMMTAAWLITGGFVYWLIPGLSYLECLVIGACVVPTDPVMANAICRGRFADKYVPVNVRNVLLGEAGANDGLGLPYLMLAIYLVRRTDPAYHWETVGHAIQEWFLVVILYEVVMSAVIGALLGYIARKLIRYVHDRHLISHENFIFYGLGLGFLTLGFLGIIGSDDLFACFIVGAAFNWDGWYSEMIEGQAFAEIIDTMMGSLIFLFTGAVLPWALWSDPVVSTWRLVVLGIMIIFFCRLPCVLALKPVMPALRTWRDGMFAGFFGPIGVGTLYWTTEALEALPHNDRSRLREVLMPVTFFLILISVVIHGFSIPIITTIVGIRRYRQGGELRTETEYDDVFGAEALRPARTRSRISQNIQRSYSRYNLDQPDEGYVPPPWVQNDRRTLALDTSTSIKFHPDIEEGGGGIGNGPRTPRERQNSVGTTASPRRSILVRPKKIRGRAKRRDSQLADSEGVSGDGDGEGDDGDDGEDDARSEVEGGAEGDGKNGSKDQRDNPLTRTTTFPSTVHRKDFDNHSQK